MKLLIRLLLLGLLTLVSIISHASIDVASGTVESKYIEVIEGMCLANKDDFSHIDKIAVGLKLKPIPDELLQGDMVLANRGGKGYVVEEVGQKFMVAYAIGGGCSVVASQVNLDELKKKLLSAYKLKLIKENDEGMQVMEFYRFELDSLYAGDILAITYPKERESKDIVSISYLPEKVYLDSLKDGK